MKASWTLLIGLLLGPMIISAAPRNDTPTSAGDYLVYVASYSPQGTGGIYAFRFNPQTAEMSALELAAPLDNPAWIAFDPNRRFLYAVTKHEDRGGALHAFRIDKATGRLAELNSTPSGVKDACYISVDRTGTSVAVAACEDGAIAIRRIKSDGSLGDQTAAGQHSGPGARAGSVYFSPDNKFVLSPDLGLDEVFVDRFDSAKGALAPDDPPFTKMQPGSTPNRLAFHPNGKFVYVFSATAGALTAFNWDAEHGVMKEAQKIGTVPAGFTVKNNGQEVQVNPNGRFLYAVNGGPELIAVFAIGADGSLTLADQVYTQGDLPTDFAIDPTGAYLLAANRKTNAIVLFKVDQNTGHLTPMGKMVHVEAPVCLSGFLPLN
jgi:6-phosphogluconolactonase